MKMKLVIVAVIVIVSGKDLISLSLPAPLLSCSLSLCLSLFLSLLIWSTSIGTKIVATAWLSVLAIFQEPPGRNTTATSLGMPAQNLGAVTRPARSNGSNQSLNPKP